MSLDDQKLRAIYQGCDELKKPSSGKGCPSPRKMIRLLRSWSSERETTKLVDHISHCRSCAVEFRFLLEALRHEEKLIDDLGRWLSAKNSAKVQEGARQRSLKPGIDRRPFFLRLSRSTAFLLTGFVLVGLLVAGLWIFRTPEKYRAGTGSAVELLFPVDKQISSSGLVFRWKKTRNLEYYVLELYDKALSPVWKSERISDNFAALPRAVAEKLEINGSYFWMITARSRGGEDITSRLEEFTVKK
jgi:hypothetical protein